MDFLSITKWMRNLFNKGDSDKQSLLNIEISSSIKHEKKTLLEKIYKELFCGKKEN